MKSLLPQGEKGFRDEGKKICQSTRPSTLSIWIGNAKITVAGSITQQLIGWTTPETLVQAGDLFWRRLSPKI